MKKVLMTIDMQNGCVGENHAKYFIKAIIFALLSAILSTPLQVLNSMFVLHEPAPPEPSFLIKVAVIGIVMKILYATAYVLMGKKLPIKSQRLRAFVFIAIIWSSDYIPQVLGLIGADGPIAKSAFNFPLVACDSLSYLMDGFLLGCFYRHFPYYEKSECSKSSLIKTSIISAILFPLFVFACDQLLGLIYSPLYVVNALEVSDAKIIPFSISFYGCFIITGALLPFIYRFTEYNTRNSFSALRFGLIYSLCLWAPVVFIMVAFGTNVWITSVYVVVFTVCIVAVAKLNDCLITKLSHKRDAVR